ncbi:MAG: hypothetical protein AAFR62_10995 [Cyanobacteria bacterium J06629_2]
MTINSNSRQSQLLSKSETILVAKLPAHSPSDKTESRAFPVCEADDGTLVPSTHQGIPLDGTPHRTQGRMSLTLSPLTVG